MSLKVGLGASEEDLEVQGEIDFDFFENDESSIKIDKIVEDSECNDQNDVCISNKCDSLTNIENVSSDSQDKIIAPRLEMIIPSPENYKQDVDSSSATTKPPYRLNGKVGDYNDLLNSILASNSGSDLSSSSSSCSLTDDSFEETDSMTDVSPLSSNCQSPMVFPKEDIDNNLQPISDTCSKDENLQCNQNNTPSTLTPIGVNNLLKSFKQLDLNSSNNINLKPKPRTPFAETSNGKCKKNSSFTDEEVRKIDQDNQRLLKKILAQQNRPKPQLNPVRSRPSSSSINRQKQQRQIELDNMALLQRLEAAKPSKDLSRLHLLNEYKQRASAFSLMSFKSANSVSLPASCRNSAHKSGRSSTLTVPPCSRSSRR